MKKVLYTLLLTFIGSSSFAQNYERCMTPQAIDWQESITPGFIKDVNAVFNSAKNLNAKINSDYTIPVVVHVVYNSPEMNLADSVIENQIQILTEDYNRLNADTVNMRSDFDIVAGSPSIKFKLAQIDEFGAPTTGITRTSTTTQFGSLLILGGDFSDLEKVKSTVDGGHDPWDQSRYLNIWVCDMSVFGITALLGYATPPANLPNWPPGSTNGLSDGVVLQFQTVGSNNPNVLDAGGGPIDVRGRTATHEVGHYLGLRHIWGDGDCTAQDGIDDTPNATDQSQNDCDPSKNTCTDNIQGVDLPDMIENYMDYSAETCQNSFTDGQTALMHGVLEDQRFDLVHGNPASLAPVEATAWMIAPNPTNGELNVSSMTTITSLQVISTSGRIIKNLQPAQNEVLLNLSDLDQGMYFIQIESNGTQSSKRVIVQ